MQQLPDIEKTDPQRTFLPKMENTQWYKSMRKLQNWYIQVEYCRVSLPKHFVPRR